MSHFSPAAVLLWSIISTLLLVFLVWHLWKFDRFACLGWGTSSTSRTGGFKRLMTYSYLLCVPLLLFYSVTFATIKYYEGWFVVGPGQIVPKPYELWDSSPKRWILTLYIVFSLSWALEIVSHLEELNFWLFLMSPNTPRSYFRSSYFVTWALGSVAALGGLPATAVVTRHDPLKSEAWIFFVGSVGSLTITVASLRVLWLFPRFIALLRKQGADPETIVRLSTYSQLNNIRVLFRFLFVLPLFTLAVDGIRPGHHHDVNEDIFATDILAMVAGIGCIVQSALTLLVFFPRSIAQENGYTLLAQPSTNASALRSGAGRDYDYDIPPYPYPGGQVGSMPTPDEGLEHRRKAQEWLARQQRRGRSASMSSQTSRGGTMRVSTTARPISGVSRYSYRTGGEFEEEEEFDERERDGDEERDRTVAVTVAENPLSPTTPQAQPQAQLLPQKKPFRVPKSSSNAPVVEPGTRSRGAGAASISIPLRPRPAYNADREGGGGPDATSPTDAYGPGSPFEYDYVDVESGAATARQGGYRLSRTSSISKAALLPGRNGRTVSGWRDDAHAPTSELADVPFNEMRARGSRFTEIAVRRAEARGEEIHPFLKSFKSPLDLYDSVGKGSSSYR